MSKQNQTKKQPNKIKIYGIAILIYLLVNGLVFETFITLLENQLETPLFPMFPYTRLALLIITILIANKYIDKRSSEPKKKQSSFYSITKAVIFALILVGLTYGAFFSVEFYDPTPSEPIEFPELEVPQPTKIDIDKLNIEQ